MPSAGEILDKSITTVLAKLTSARFLAATISMATLSAIAMKALLMVGAKEISKEIFFAIFTGFSTVVGSIVTFYFTREHYKNNKDNNEVG